jgi:hypothetical protein
MANCATQGTEEDMDHRVRLNYAAIVVAGIVFWCIQAGWYTVFGPQWVVAIGKNMADMQKGASPIPYIGSLICDIIVACVLAWVVTRLGAPSALKGAAIGAIFALGIVATSLMTQYLFEQRPITLFLINSGAALLGMSVMGAIVGVWRKSETPKASTVTA